MHSDPDPRIITGDDFRRIVDKLGPIAASDIEWAESIQPPTDADEFALETIFVVCNSGMNNVVARGIFNRVRELLRSGKPVSGNILGKSGKAQAIDAIWAQREQLLKSYLDASDKLAFCQTVPWIGGITCYHMAKNFGADVAKPDVHLQRLADREGVTAQALCERLAATTGHRVATIDTVLWRACAVGLIDSKTGAIDWGADLIKVSV
jgi:hypothetical protein